MNGIRKYAKAVDHKIIGKLTRKPEWEYNMDYNAGTHRHSGCRHYADEGGNEYIVGKGGISIVTTKGDVI